MRDCVPCPAGPAWNLRYGLLHFSSFSFQNFQKFEICPLLEWYVRFWIVDLSGDHMCVLDDKIFAELLATLIILFLIIDNPLFNYR